MKTVSLPPHAPTLIESTRAIGYSVEAAIADIIDNSISASATVISIFFLPLDGGYVAILDNGKGMNSDELDIAMRYGSFHPNDKRAENDMGRFGLGLKTASLSQCRVLTVVSKKDDHIEGRQWNLDVVKDNNDWSLIIFDEPEELKDIPCIEKLETLHSGTLVVWQDLDRLIADTNDVQLLMSNKMEEVRDHLSLVFHRYLAGESGLKKIKIEMNYNPVKPVDPFLSQRNTQVMDDEVLNIHDSIVTVKSYVLPHTSSLTTDEINLLGGKEGLRKSQGFYIYRNKRLLVWGTWFRMMRQGELSKLVRIQVDIPNEMDSLWTLDIKKSTAIPPETVRRNLKSIIDHLASVSKRTWEFRGRKEFQDSTTHLWNRLKGRQGGYLYVINQSHPLVEHIKQNWPLAKRSLESLLISIERSLPLNQLELDITSDKDAKIENGILLEEADIEGMLQAILAPIPSKKQKDDLLKRLSFSDPFEKYPELLEKFKNGGDSDA